MLAHFSLLGCFFRVLGVSWALFAVLGRFFRVLDRLGVDFVAFWDAPGRVLEAPKPYFSWFFCARALAM